MPSVKTVLLKPVLTLLRACSMLLISTHHFSLRVCNVYVIHGIQLIIIHYNMILTVFLGSCLFTLLAVNLSSRIHWYILSAIVAIFYPSSQFCEMNMSLLSLQKQPNTAPNLFQRGVEYGKYGLRWAIRHPVMHALCLRSVFKISNRKFSN